MARNGSKIGVDPSGSGIVNPPARMLGNCSRNQLFKRWRLDKMARPREFDEAAVLDAAIERFWLRGYEATSVRDLADEMNIAGASLYNTFGDKRSLYERALNRYLDSTFRERIRRLEPSLPPR